MGDGPLVIDEAHGDLYNISMVHNRETIVPNYVQAVCDETAIRELDGPLTA